MKHPTSKNKFTIQKLSYLSLFILFYNQCKNMNHMTPASKFFWLRTAINLKVSLRLFQPSLSP